RLTRILRTISEINQAILRERDSAVLLQRACEILVDQRGFSFAWIGLLEADGATVKKIASAGENADPSSGMIRLEQARSDINCPVKKIEMQKPYCVKQAGESICAFCPLHAHRDPARSSVAISLVRNGRPLGIMVVMHSNPMGTFELDELELLKDLSDDLAYALENINAEEQRRLLTGVTNELLSAHTVDALWPIIMASVRRALSSDRVAVYLYARESDRLSCPHSIGLSVDYVAELNRRFHEAPGGRILASNEPVVVNDVLTDPIAASMREWMEREGFRSYAVFPLIGSQGIFGALVAYRDAQSIFSEADISAGQTLAHMFGLAYENLRLYSDASAKAAELGKMYAALQEMTASLLDPPALLRTLSQHMAQALNVTSSYLIAVNQANGSMTTLAEYWAEAAMEPERKSDEGVVFFSKDYPNIMKAMFSGEVLILHRDDPRLAEREQAQFVDYDIQTMLFIPISFHGKLLGDVELWESRHRREFSQAEIRLAQAMASQASVVIENARLFTETRQRENELSTMLEVARAVSSSLDLSDVLKQAATSMARILRVDDCILSEYDSTSRVINTLARYSLSGEVDPSRDEGIAFPLKEYPVSEQVMLSGEPIVIHVNDLKADPAEVAYLQNHGYKVSLLLPLRVHNSPLGMAELCSFEPNREFQPDEIRLALALADRAYVLEVGRIVLEGAASEVAGDALVVDGRTIRVFKETDPGKLPWAELGVEIVIE
ncbi:MAG: GAF domain-containing protein, partial [Anaerolineales bacterium]|nr:GAF domain-containing protein [Anaerolineales bacterium]